MILRAMLVEPNQK